MKHTTTRIALFPLMLVIASMTHAFSQEAVVSEEDIWNTRKLTILKDSLHELITRLKALAARPMPVAYENASDKAADWKRQTVWLEGVITIAENHLKNFTEAVKEGQITSTEGAQATAACLRYAEYEEVAATNAKSTAGQLQARYQSAHAMFNALCNNEVIEGVIKRR